MDRYAHACTDRCVVTVSEIQRDMCKQFLREDTNRLQSVS